MCIIIARQNVANMCKGEGGGGGGGRGGGGWGAAAKRKSVGAGRSSMTFEEKRTLSLNIGKLSQDKLGKVVEIIKKKKKLDDGEEFEIDIDSLGESTLRELEKYCNDCLNPKTVCNQSTCVSVCVSRSIGMYACVSPLLCVRSRLLSIRCVPPSYLISLNDSCT